MSLLPWLFVCTAGSEASKKEEEGMTLSVKIAELRLVPGFEESGVLKIAHPRDIEFTRQGAVLVFCGDVEHGIYGYRFLERAFKSRDLEPRIHQVSGEGGPLCLSTDSKLNRKKCRSVMVLEQVQKSLELEDTRDIVLWGEWPCPTARDFGISFPDAIGLLAKAEDRVRRVDARIHSLLRLNDADGRVFRVSSEKWWNPDLE